MEKEPYSRLLHEKGVVSFILKNNPTSKESIVPNRYQKGIIRH